MKIDERKAYKKAWREAHIDEYKAYSKAYAEAHKEQTKAYYQANREEQKAYSKAYYQAHREEKNAYSKAYREAHKEQMKEYQKSDVNSLGQTKNNIRSKSNAILKKKQLKIHGYEIHHCFGYDNPNKFIYCSKELHLKIHQFLRDNNIDADSDHYEQIKHLLDNSVVKYGID